MNRLNDEWGMVWLDDGLIPAGEACVEPFDRGFLYGDGVYETIRVYCGKPFRLDAHIQRMERGCSVIGLVPPETGRIGEAVLAVLDANHLSDAYLRITLTRGATGRLWFDTEHSGNRLFVMAKALIPPDFNEGMRLGISEFRSDERSPLSGVKQTGILPKILARKGARESGLDDALLLDTRSFISEATSSNIFWARDGRLYTPALTCGILAGITREALLEIAPGHGIETVEGEFPPDHLLSAEEVFLTSSTWEIAPVRSIAGKTYPSPGPLTRKIGELYRIIVEEYI